MADRPPEGLSWNGFKSWYSNKNGRTSHGEISTAYQNYKANVVQPKKEVKKSPKRKSVSPVKSPKKASPKKSPKSLSPKKSPKKSPKSSPIRRTQTKSPVTKQRTPDVKLSIEKEAGKKSPTKTKLCVAAKEFVKKEYDLSSLICAQLGATKIDWPTILRNIQSCTPLQCTPCTSVGYKIARSLIRVAATRVFSTPEQSILEPIVNSYDAYNPARKVGKFGMGWFSTLYWLIGHPKRYMQIASTYLDETNTLCIFEATIREVNGNLQFKLDLPGQHTGIRVQNKVGLTMIINAKEDKFSSDELVAFYEQLLKLKYVKGPLLRVTQAISRYRVGQGGVTGKDIILEAGTDITKPINGQLDPDKLKFEDNATGYSMETFFGSVLVPSISTKTIGLAEEARATDAEEANVEILSVGGIPSFLILVSDIVVVTIQGTLSSIRGATYKITLPSSTRVPVSRDDIILHDKKAKDIFRNALSKLLEEAAKLGSIQDIEVMMEKYVKYTSNTDNKEIVESTIEQFYAENAYRLVPSKYLDVYKTLNNKSVGSTRYDVAAIEKWLDTTQKPDKNIWYGIKVIFIPSSSSFNVSQMGLYSYLFINGGYYNTLNHKTWSETVTSSFFETKLYLVSSQQASVDYSKYDEDIDIARNMGRAVFHLKLLQFAKDQGIETRNKNTEIYKPSDVFDPNALQMFYNVKLRLESLGIYFVIPAEISSLFTEILLAVYVYLNDAYYNICGELLRKMSEFKGNQTYGGNKYTLSNTRLDGFHIQNESEFAQNHPEKKKILQYLEQHIIAVIRSIKEEQNTQFSVTTENTTYKMLSMYYRPTAPQEALMEQAIKQTRNFVEYTMVIAGGGHGFADIESTSQRKNIPTQTFIDAAPTFVTAMLTRVRARYYSMPQLVSLYGYWQGKYFKEAPLTFVSLVEDRTFGKQWLADLTKVDAIPVIDMPTQELWTTKVILSSLINHLFRDNFQQGKLKNYLETASNTKSGTKLQIIEIATNEGTTKPPLDAMMTELTQNSIDVTRESGISMSKDFGIKIKLSRTTNNSYVVLSVYDTIGMNDDAFLYVSVPFLSTKTPSELVTGEMGSGFMNVYRISSAVIIDSVRDGIRRYSYDTIIKDKHERTVDVVKNTKVTKLTPEEAKNTKNGTTISVIIPTKDRMEFVSVVSRASYIAKYVLGMAMAPGITFNREKIQFERRLVAKVGSFELYYTLQANKPEKHDSYLLTKGIPFQPLATYIDSVSSVQGIDHLKENFIVNILHGGYTPVQTRTKIRFTEQAEREFKTIIGYGRFLSALFAVIDENKTDYISNYNSTTDAEQIRFSEYDVSALRNYTNEQYLLNTSYMGQQTIAQLINSCITALKGRQFSDPDALEDIEKIFNTYKLVDNRNQDIVLAFAAVFGYVQKLVIGWLTTKNKTGIKIRDIQIDSEGEEEVSPKPSPKKSPPKKLPSKIPEEPEIKSVPDNAFQPTLQKWVNVFWRLGSKAKIKGIVNRTVPIVIAVKTNEPYAGRYEPQNHIIRFNTVDFDRKDINAIIKAMGNSNLAEIIAKTLKDNKVWQQGFSYTFPSSTLIHELEHARRNDGHQTSFHGQTTELLWPEDTQQTRTFEQSANAVYAKILGLGFYAELTLEYNLHKKRNIT